jgi:hypothetical protein
LVELRHQWQGLIEEEFEGDVDAEVSAQTGGVSEAGADDKVDRVSMKAIGWNCQGKGLGMELGSAKMCYLGNLIFSTKAQIIFVSEIKSSKVKSSHLI